METILKKILFYEVMSLPLNHVLSQKSNTKFLLTSIEPPLTKKMYN